MNKHFYKHKSRYSLFRKKTIYRLSLFFVLANSIFAVQFAKYKGNDRNLQWDEQLFQLINGSWHNPVLDAVMPWWRNKYVWFPLYVFIASFFLLNFRKRGAFLILAIGLTVGTADFVSSSIIKKSVQRLRPCNTELLKNDMQLLVRCGSGYSFPSSHAANHFAMAVVLFFTLGKILKRTRIPLLLWAASIAFGQVYVGVHYPLDVFMGSLLGILIGLIGAFFIKILKLNP